MQTFTKQMSEMTAKITDHTDQLRVLVETTDQHTKDLKQIDERLKVQEKGSLKQLKANDIEVVLRAENNILKQRLLKLEEYSRRKNLIFSGFEEKEGENCIQLTHHYIVTQLKLQEDRK